MEPRKEEKKSRFQIEKLEERIAPCVQGIEDPGANPGDEVTTENPGEGCPSIGICTTN